ncbi:DNA-binding MarR family transcriptional regulator [Dysgonomonas sp. PFB1-18]|uniref:MarR family winged helix-turn-helix transcriptional regulator n=1 Tax=unclassified Dysgonomonas TaxID=2630389 RepID=UPI002475CA30|nr:MULTISPECIES: winged helix DNA-binding protein [unclassified Dysgonomonas]MDL2303465.1 winged helix DNA-binding protein [Dysgonomonas sp. OttesenSCG-928-D17]MDH6307114.1 DNA-binding MarR family transcriptional regulator [Dysgonomonas sp. PF1-14]MDH6337033.1 DNA-binding MarR family transcriptional regulator [Dysgonomonas sp. PF1-16]MDH6381019.1 DNA-binding MarR family transcriptional regulator [Dysgonomonas sp. PFB1-18]MDH6396402.1 DNA-binding MarR family transcriptional regulator [Dysgonomo
MEPICKLKDVYKALYNFEKEFAEKNGITINEGMLLCCLKDGKPKSANELCDFVGLSNSRVSRIITTVEAKGYIERTMGTTDKRQMIFTLTELGKEKTDAMQAQNMDFSGLATQVSGLIG